MSILLTAIYFYLCLNVVAAQTHNATGNSTAADPAKDHIGWKSSPDGRSTMDIIWSCASVLLVCTYKCLHMNIPSFEEKQAGWHRKWYILFWPEWPMIKMKLRKIKWMAIILIAPEMGVMLAVYQFAAAREKLQKARRKFPDEKLTLTHAFYALAGGFAIGPGPGRVVESPAQLQPPTTTGLFQLDLMTYVDICKQQNLQIATEEDLNDRSKSDFFTKTFAIVQSTWLVVQSIARVSAGLPLSELELATIAYVFCAVVIYAFWWHKPFDVEHVTVVESQETIQAKYWKKQPELKTLRGSGSAPFIVLSILETNKISWSPKAVFTMTVTTIFSAIHLAAWNWGFPEPVSRTLWRSFAIASTVVGFLIMGLGLLIVLLDYLYGDHGLISNSPRLYDIADDTFMVVFLLLMLLYIISRIGLMVLVLYTFSSMPVGVYETIDWATYLPHFS
ncbi:hypothetical protein VTL71DRAFT_12859 [Oculimacula yallundae]|uniref:Uncharacterized protein n=1 Tax=Oculimacula yallundae TaxID=86028 RepID=A0ABR4CP71_9HELO